MKKIIFSMLALASVATVSAQELVEVMQIEKQDTVLTFKVADIKSFSFDMKEWVEIPADTIPEEIVPEDTIPADWGLHFTFANPLLSIAATDTLALSVNAVDSCYVDFVAEGWDAVLTDSTLLVTAPNETDIMLVASVNLVALNAKGESKSYYLTYVCMPPIQEQPEQPGEDTLAYELRILTFEDADAKFSPYSLDYAGAEINTWSDLIDDPEYGGPLCYGDYMSCEYSWYDEGNTELTHTFPCNFNAYCYWGGGHAVSNYASTDYVGRGGYENQLTVYGEEGKGGHNGSANFCMHFGYKDNSPYNGTEYLPAISFADGEARVIDHMYVNNCTYALNCYMNGNGLTANIGESDWVKLIATGYDAEGNATTTEFYLVNGPEHIITEWTKWDLSSLGAVVSVEFNVTGSSDNGYGFSQPAYFAYDDVAVRF